MRRLAAVLVVGLVLAGCSSKKQAEPAASETPAATATATAGTPTPTATPCAVPGATTQAVEESGSGKQALLNDVGAATTTCPRVVFAFENIPPVSYVVEYRNPPFSNCGSGARVDTSGWGSSAYVVFHSNQASGVDLTGPTFRQTYKKSKDIAVASPVLRRVYETCDFEGTLEWVIALDARHSFKVSKLTGPPRLVVDISQAG
jgi:putative hemolysin